MSFAAGAIKYFNNLNSASKKNRDVDIVNPHSNNEVKDCVSAYYKKFYSDNNERVFIIGINPGRFGGGLTGISFTDPVALREHCGIDNQLGNQKELSSRFVYSVINEFGGPQLFF